MIKNYVRYIDEIDNPYINKIDFRDPKLSIMKSDKEGNIIQINPITLEGYWPSRFKYVRSTTDLMATLSANETLIVEINFDEVDKISQENLFSYKFPESKTAETIGSKTYLVDYDFALEGLPREIRNKFTPAVALKLPEEGMYRLGDVHTITGSIHERRNDIKSGYGEYSDLYLKITDYKVAEMFEDDVIEFTQIAPKKWMITRLPEYLKDTPSK